MVRLRELLARLRGLFSRAKRDAELSDELRAHLEFAEQENIRRGMTKEEARYAARRDFGGVEQVKEIYRDRRGLPVIETLVQDLIYGVRLLRKSPGITALAILTLALGIGASTAILTVIDSLVFPTLPYPHSGQLYLLLHAPVQINHTLAAKTLPIDWMDRTRSFEAITSYYIDDLAGNLHATNASEHILRAEVQPNFFDVLGVHPILGQALPRDRAGAPVVISYSLWQRDLKGDPNVIGSQIKFQGMPKSVVGVAPPGFSFPPGVEAWILPNVLGEQKVIIFGSVLARLKPGISPKAAQAEMKEFGQQVEKLAGRKLKPIEVTPLAGFDAASVRDALYLLFGAAGLVLLIGCANVASLNSSRVVGRRRELAVRTAMGAGRLRLLRQLLIENSVTALFAGAAGWGLAYAGVAAVKRIGRDILPRAQEIHLDARVLFFALGLSLLTGVLSGLLPALSAIRVSPSEALKEDSGRQSGSARFSRLTQRLVVAEIALALLLAMGAGLLLRSFALVLHVPPGYDPGQVLTAATWFAGSSYATPQAENEHLDAVLRRISEIPGVDSAGATTLLPLRRSSAGGLRFTIAENPKRSSEETGDDAIFIGVTPDYFRALAVPLLEGRKFNAADTAISAPVLIVSRSFANRYWPGGSAIGKHLLIGENRSPNAPREIVGVVGDVRPFSLERDDGLAQVYMPHVQNSYYVVTALAIRSRVSPAGIVPAVRAAMAELAPDSPPYDIRTMGDRLSVSLGRRQLILLLMGVMAGMAVALGAIGVFVMTANAVTLRTREIGIRMALGAQQHGILRMILSQSMRWTVMGIGLGLVSAAAMTRLLSSMLYGVHAGDPITFLTVITALVGVTILAAYLPARRATRVDPVETLRHE